MNQCNALSRYKFEPSQCNILIVEDSKSINSILTETFIKLGFRCYSTFTLQEAKEILVTTEINYVMLDLNLPDGSGKELILSLVNTPEKIFVLTTENDETFKKISYQKGVIDFITKDKNFFHKIQNIASTIEQLEKNKTKTVLIIDDSIVIQSQIKDLLQNRNYLVQTTSNTQEALEIIKKNQVDFIILDIELKDSNGLDFLQKNENEIINIKKIPVMIISGTVTPSLIRDGIKAGAIDVLQKPYVIEELILKVDLWVDYRRKNEEVICSTKLLAEYKDAVDESSIVSKTDIKGNITYVNEEFTKISGYTKDELIGKPHNVVRHPDMPKKAFEEMWDTIKNQKKTWKGKVKNRKKDGTHYWVNALIKPIIDAQGNIVEFIGLRHDITEEEDVKEYFKQKLQSSQKDLLNSIKLSQEYERAIDESNILSRADLSGNITYANKKFEEISGYSNKELIGSNHNIIRHPDTSSALFKELWETIQKGEVFKGIIKNKSKSGQAYWADTVIVPIKNDNDEIIEYMSIRHDLTELFNLHKEIEDTQKDVVYKMGEIGETRSKETGNHVKRVAEYSRVLAQLYGLSDREADILFTASPMHDIGKVGIPDSVLKKPGKLTDEEFQIMQSHAEIGYSVLKGSTREVLKAAAIVSYEHHEKWNGKGYPRGLEGEEIHIFGRITAIADVFDALGSNRVYKKAWDDDEIFKLFENERGIQFDPNLVDLFLEHKELFLEIREKLRD